jgi:hypothetical protein
MVPGFPPYPHLNPLLSEPEALLSRRPPGERECHSSIQQAGWYSGTFFYKKLNPLKGEKRLRFIHKVLENSGGKI